MKRRKHIRTYKTFKRYLVLNPLTTCLFVYLCCKNYGWTLVSWSLSPSLPMHTKTQSQPQPCMVYKIILIDLQFSDLYLIILLSFTKIWVNVKKTITLRLSSLAVPQANAPKFFCASGQIILVIYLQFFIVIKWYFSLQICIIPLFLILAIDTQYLWLDGSHINAEIKMCLNKDTF